MLNLGKILKTRKISQKEIAICCGVSQPTVSEWISGRKNPSLENLTKLSRYLDISIDCILGENSEEQKESSLIGEKIKNARLSKGYTQEELGQMIGVQKSAIAKYESGRVVNIKRSTIQKLSDILGIRPSELIVEEQKDTTPVSENDIKVALFGGAENVTDEMWEEVKQFAEFVKNKRK